MNIKNLIINNGKVSEVDSIPEKIENLKEGQFYSGFSSDLKTKYNIGNLDAGKSAQLMKLVLENKKKIPFVVMIILYFFAFLVSVGVLVVGYNLVMGLGKEKPPISKDIIINQGSGLIRTQAEKPKEEKEIVIEEKKIETKIETSGSSEILYSHDFISNNFNFEIEKLKFENFKNLDIIEDTKTKIKILEEELAEKSETIKIMSLEIANKDKEINILSSNEKFKKIGLNISKICAETQIEKVKTSCTELFYQLK